MKRFGVFAAAAALLLTACGGGDNDDDKVASDGDSTTTAAADASSKSKSGQKVRSVTDACSLFTTEQIAAFTGAPVSAGKALTVNPLSPTFIGGTAVAICEWRYTSDGAQAVKLDLGYLTDVNKQARFMDDSVSANFATALPGIGAKATWTFSNTWVLGTAYDGDTVVNAGCNGLVGQGDLDETNARTVSNCVTPILQEALSKLS